MARPRRRLAPRARHPSAWQPGHAAPPQGAACACPAAFRGRVPRGARMLHGDARHTHRAAGRAPGHAPVVAWTRDVGGPVEAQVTTSPDEQTLYVASLGGTLTALARADGAVKWKLDPRRPRLRHALRRRGRDHLRRQRR